MSLHTSLEQHWQALETKLADIPQWPSFYQQLTITERQLWQRVVCHSDYVVDCIRRQPEYFLSPDNPLDTQVTKTWLHQQDLWHSDKLAELTQAEQENLSMQQLRRLRQRAMVHIIAGDVGQLRSTMTTTQALSDLADYCIQYAVDICSFWQQQRFGQPLSANNQTPQKLMVLGMGKLGAAELNLSSDIDLIFVYPNSGYTDGEKSISNQEFFTKVGQKLIQLLDKQTLDGFVFRTDMRLRPYGDSGPLVLNFASMQDYYQTQGRDWERFAMIKARLVTQHDESCEKNLWDILNPFTYRQYVDFSALASLRSMKAMIQTEVRRRGFEDNVKLGQGGIREIEFIVQTFQLIRGGQDIQLQHRSLEITLNYLVDEQQLPAEVGQELWQAYLWLRNTEHAIQAIRDSQTQQLPEAELDRQRIAYRMNCEDWQDFSQQLAHHRQRVHHHFRHLIHDSTTTDNINAEQPLWQAWWLGQLHPDTELANPGDPSRSKTELYSKMDIVKATQPHAWSVVQLVNNQLSQFRQQRSVEKMQAISRQRLDAVMPQLIRWLWQTPEPDTTLDRLLPLIDNILRRSSYLNLLQEQPDTLQQLVEISGRSAWVAEYIARIPLLLDELVDQHSLKHMPTRSDLASELEVRLLRIESDDLEQQMETLRHFVHAHKLRAAACEIFELHHITRISDYLSWLAEVSLNRVMQIAWRQMVSRYGYPSDAHGDPVHDPEFAVIGYGKLGGLELNYQSDLDMVFIHQGHRNGLTCGDRPIENSVFYTRMGQRMIHILGTQTRSGIMYEVDMRLRPSGASGMIVASIVGYDEYQHKHAWTWEHQALVRARFICGCQDLHDKFNQSRRDILTKPRQPEALREEVRAMRIKMRDNLGTNDSSGQRFHLKQDAGGIVDIEFLVQFWILSWAQQHSILLKSTDNLGLLEILADLDLISANDCGDLQQSYLSYRAESHRRALHNQPTIVDMAAPDSVILEHHRRAVIQCWNRWLENK